jgi:multidrug efflux pump subunit AcrA (membrane-fusion protein)
MPDFQITETARRQRRRGRLMLWCGGGLAALAGLAALLYWLPNGPAIDAATLVTAHVQSGTFAVSVQAPGTLKSRDVRYVTAAVPGTVEDVAVQAGDHVQPGSVLLHLANPQLQAAVVAARAALADAQATLVSTQADLDNQLLALQASLSSAQAAAAAAALKVQAERGLEAEHVIAELDYQSSILDAADARAQVGLTIRRIAAFRRNEAAQLTAQRTRVAAFQAALDEAAQNVAALTVTAGQPGVVQSVAPQPGQTLALGDPIAQVASVTALKAVLAVAPSDAGEVAAGQSAQIALNNALDTMIAGTVTRVSPSVVDGNVAVDVALPARLPGGTRPDLAVLGQVSVTSIAHALFVTRPVGAAPNSAGEVYELVDGGHRAVQVAVRFGAASATTIQILSGLPAGAQIVVSDTGAFDGAPKVDVR